ncbi:hypothetical protein [Streptomyces sp. NPDC002088]|uniref:hypothetical protein n=1 Tax=Streptomyces sp. NPDC002088 TaxID=3154665 RepID=UPI00332DA456
MLLVYGGTVNRPGPSSARMPRLTRRLSLAQGAAHVLGVQAAVRVLEDGQDLLVGARERFRDERVVTDLLGRHLQERFPGDPDTRQGLLGR